MKSISTATHFEDSLNHSTYLTTKTTKKITKYYIFQCSDCLDDLGMRFAPNSAGNVRYGHHEFGHVIHGQQRNRITN